VVEQVQDAVAPRKKTGLWVGLGVGALFLCIAAVVGMVLFRDKIPFLAAPVPTQTEIVVQASPTPTVPAPTATLPVVVEPVAIDTPAPTDTPAPSPTPTTAKLPSLGGADLIAILSNKNIWLMNVDGNDLRQLTKDGAEKKNLQWAPDGKSLFYINGKCIQNATLPDGTITTVTCFNSANYVEAFEISPDGSLVAISVNRYLFITPLDVAAISGAHNMSQLAVLPGSLFKYPDLTRGQTVKYVRWQKNSKMIAADRVTPSGGKTLDNIFIYDLTGCTSANPCDGSTFFETRYKTQFPAGRFEMEGLGTSGGRYSIIPAFDWNEEGLFLLNSINRNDVYGYLYTYNNSTFNGKQIDPLGSRCCYADARWSPDGSYLLFSYQDMRLGSGSKNQLYYIQYGSLSTGGMYTPLPLPENILNNINDHPDPALRPAR
jgi:hypothetical protein